MTTSNRTSTEKETVNSQLFDKPQRRNVSSSKRSVISDPLVSINDRLEELSNLVAMMKDTKTKIESIKETFMDDLTSFLDDDDDSRPMITHTNDKNMKVFLQIRKTYEYSQQLVEKRTRIKNLQADLKAMEEKAVRDGKASLIKKDYSVVFKG
tara:strand:- start:230 stop:688 length:459 start_codon:yes stop_codon:yes gene_type:complete